MKMVNYCVYCLLFKVHYISAYMVYSQMKNVYYYYERLFGKYIEGSNTLRTHQTSCTQ